MKPTQPMNMRDLVRRGGLCIGTYLGEFVTPGIGRILAGAGCEFAWLDMEHSGFTFETAKLGLRSLHDAGIATIIRPPSKQPDEISRACDVGAQGLTVASVDSEQVAREIVEAMKYPPSGRRGVAVGIAHDNYVPRDFERTMQAGNDRTVFFPMIETAEGAENVEAIAEVTGVDGLWIGHYDLSVSLGIPGEFSHPRYMAAERRTIAAARRQGIPVGRGASKIEDARRLRSAGIDLIMYSGDIWLLQAALASAVSGIREDLVSETV